MSLIRVFVMGGGGRRVLCGVRPLRLGGPREGVGARVHGEEGAGQRRHVVVVLEAVVGAERLNGPRAARVRPRRVREQRRFAQDGTQVAARGARRRRRLLRGPVCVGVTFLRVVFGTLSVRSLHIAQR